MSSPHLPREREADSERAPGWDSITAACDRAHPDQSDPVHVGTVVRWSLGGNDPLDGISVYRVLRPVPHWHYVGYGLSDLYTDDVAPDGALSGFGFELTFRLADTGVADPAVVPPVWPMNLLQNLARYVVTTGNAFGPGHHLDARGPLAAGSDTALTAVAFGIDPELAAIDTRRGRLTFLLVEGITADEHAAMQRWGTEGVAALIRQRNPGGVTDLGRPSITDDPAAAAQIAAGIARDGSQQGLVSVQSLSVIGSTVTLTTAAVAQLLRALPGRLPHDRPLLLRSSQGSIAFVPSAGRGLETVGSDLTLQVSPGSLDDLTRTLVADPGTYRAAGITWQVAD